MRKENPRYQVGTENPILTSEGDSNPGPQRWKASEIPLQIWSPRF